MFKNLKNLVSISSVDGKNQFSCLVNKKVHGQLSGVLQKNLFLEISQNSQENTCTEVFF